MKVEVLPGPQEARERLRAAQEALVKAAREDKDLTVFGSELMEAAAESMVAHIYQERIVKAKSANPKLVSRLRHLLNL